jgi:hypothetical protein
VWVLTKPLITEENWPGRGLNPGLPNDTPALYPLLHKLMLFCTFFTNLVMQTSLLYRPKNFTPLFCKPGAANETIEPAPTFFTPLFYKPADANETIEPAPIYFTPLFYKTGDANETIEPASTFFTPLFYKPGDANKNIEPAPTILHLF